MIARILKEKRRIVLPLSRRVAGSQARANEASMQLAHAMSANRAAQATLEGRERTDNQLAKFYVDVLPRDQAAARRMTYLRLAQLADEANLEYSQRAFRPDREKESTLTRMDMDIALEGDYRDIRRFIHTLETAPEFVIIRAVALAPAVKAEDTASKGAAAGPGPLTVTLTLATYFRAGDEQR